MYRDLESGLLGADEVVRQLGSARLAAKKVGAKKVAAKKGVAQKATPRKAARKKAAPPKGTIAAKALTTAGGAPREK
ncbi:hypothetical protein [Paraburkholderia sp. BL6669N2]|uniref:hypothetical protein n=1 Tax=Paraburkholderia sp. BL6669N2 TaxID=1938807 RepID=UPI0015F25F32|nr:hypothetical protein [Paraburkholderia sp. BL6669N2]